MTVERNGPRCCHRRTDYTRRTRVTCLTIFSQYRMVADTLSLLGTFRCHENSVARDLQVSPFVQHGCTPARRIESQGA